jgi:hypothetical protein
LFTIFDFIAQAAYDDTGVITAEQVAPFVLKKRHLRPDSLHCAQLTQTPSCNLWLQTQ